MSDDRDWPAGLFFGKQFGKNTAGVVKRFVRRFRSTVRAIDNGATVHWGDAVYAAFRSAVRWVGRCVMRLDTFSVTLPADKGRMVVRQPGGRQRVIGQET